IVSNTATLIGDESGYPSLSQRLLILRGTTRLHSPFSVVSGATVRNEGSFFADDGAEFYADTQMNLPPTVLNYGAFRITSATNPIYGYSALFENRGLLEVSNRTARFTAGLNQYTTNAALRLDGATIAQTSMNIEGGSLTGNGALPGGTISVDSQTLTNKTLLSGRFSVEFLNVGQAVKMLFNIGGRTNGSFDQISIADSVPFHSISLSSPTLEVRFANGFQNSITSNDVFEIISATNNRLFGNFLNVPFGQRISTADGVGSFLLYSNPPPLNAVVLKDYRSNTTFTLGFSPATVTYPFFSTFLLDPTATLTAQSNATWTGGRILLSNPEFEAAVGVNSVGNGPGQIALGGDLGDGSRPVSFEGARFAIYAPPGVLSLGLVCTFESNAAPPAIQALLRSLFFRKDHGAPVPVEPGAFTNGDARLPDRVLQLKLSDSVGTEVSLSKVLQMPYIQDLRLDPKVVVFVTNYTAHVKLFEDFSDGTVADVSDMFAYTVGSDCSSTLLRSISPAVGSINLERGSGGGDCTLSCQSGSLVASAVISVGDPCFVYLLQLLVRLSSSSPLIATSLPTLEASALSPAGAQVSLASFHALQSLMDQTGEGRRLTGLYWQHTAELVQMISTNIPLALDAAQVVLDFQPAVAALLATNGGTATITQTMIDNLNSVWNQLLTNASPSLKTNLMNERARFNNFQDFVGKNFSQWATLLQIPVPTKPWIFLSSPQVGTNGRFSMEANVVTNFVLFPWQTSDLTNWQPASNLLMQTNGYTLALTNTNAAPPYLFYQIRATPGP
ncbi:MAG TPA: hypothetical protein VI454_13780, partial [Verrucomicrobiae bacterium]